MNKYRNTKTMVYGKEFDSKTEAEYFLFLKGELKAGRVKQFTCQPVVEIQPSFYIRGEYVRKITYTPDFLVEYADGSKEYIDVKGMSTKEGEMKRKMYMYQNQRGVPLRWVAKAGAHGLPLWMDWFEFQKVKRKRKKERDEITNDKKMR